MEIRLFRHARPDLSIRLSIAPRQIPEFIARYDQAPITGAPDATALDHARHCALALCSDLPRAIATAEALGFGPERRLVDPVFAEVHLPHAEWGWPRLPALFWAILFRFLWLAGYAHDGESIGAARARARLAAARLICAAREHGSVALCGHGFMNRLIGEELYRLGWRGPHHPGYRYWGCTHYRVDSPPEHP